MEDSDYDENNHKLAAEQELHMFSSIIENYDSALQGKLQALDMGARATNAVKAHQNIPVKINLSPFERDCVHGLQCEVEKIGKVVLALSALCKEIKIITMDVEEEMINPIFLYGEGSEEDISESSGEMQLMLSLLLPTLNKVQCYRQRCYQLLDNILRQFVALYPMPSNNSKSLINCKDIHLQVVWSHLGKLLASIVIIEEAIANNGTLLKHWGTYRRLVRNTPSMSQHFKSSQQQTFDRDTIEPLLHMLDDIERNVMQGKIFKSLCSAVASNTSIARNTVLRDELHSVLMGWCNHLETQLSSDQQWNNLTMDVVGITCVYILHSNLYDTRNNKMCKALVNLYKKMPCVTLYGNLVWSGEKYILANSENLRGLWDTKTCNSLKQFRIQFINNKMNHLSKFIQSINVQVSVWSIEMTSASTKPSSQFSRQDLCHRMSLIIQGIILGHTIKSSLISILNLCSNLNISIESHNLLSICSLLSNLKSIREVYESQVTCMLSHATPLISQFIVAQLLSALKNVAKKIGGDKRQVSKMMDVEACRSIVNNCLGTRAATTHNITTARIALSFANKKDIFKDDELSHIVVLFRRLDIMSNLQYNIDSATCTGSLLYLYRNTVDTIFTYICGGSITPSLLEGVMECVNHSKHCLMSTKHYEDQNKLMDHFRDTLCRGLHDKIISHVCDTVETELRLSTHNHLHLHARNPFITSTGTSQQLQQLPLEDPMPYLSLPPINCLGKIISIKECVEQYLSRTFYAFTVVAPHDCQIYQEMRALAQHKWDLHVHNPRLPAQSTHQGVDVLEIVRNLSVFVRSYHYSLSQQVFIEANSSHNYLNTLNITDIANSIKTHGAGIINTTVNFSYQFLVGKFKVFSQFLYDEQIKSRLIRDRKHWRNTRSAQQKWFPFERAEKFNLGIRKLGINSQGLSYLDQFRGLVTQIGNAMGYVRLVRSGGLRCSSNTARFLPYISNITSFEDHCLDRSNGNEDCNVTEVTKKAAINLDAVLNNLQQSFESDTDYFQILVEVFSNALIGGDSNDHLRNFYLIIPALSLNFVHYAISAKDLLKKKNNEGAAFTMDGFAMGVSYLLNVLDQGGQFDSLHWWSGVRRHFITQTEKVEKQRTDCLSSGDSKLSETLSLTLDRLQQHQREYELLYLTITSARGFFRGTKMKNKVADKESSNGGSDEANKSVASQ